MFEEVYLISPNVTDDTTFTVTSQLTYNFSTFNNYNGVLDSMSCFSELYQNVLKRKDKLILN